MGTNYAYEISDHLGVLYLTGNITLPVQPLEKQIVLIGDCRCVVLHVVISTNGVVLELMDAE
jgi:hypothetical protein